MKKALVLTTNNEQREIDIEADELAALQAEVGGYVECVSLFQNLDLWLNEEGKILNLPYNQHADNLFASARGEMMDVIVGNAVLTGGSDEDGEVKPLTEKAIEAVKRYLENPMLNSMDEFRKGNL